MVASLIILLLTYAVDIFTFLLLAYCIFSFFPSKPGALGKIYNFLSLICDPILNIFRRFIPPIGGMIDISPIIALLVLQFAVRIVSGLLIFIPF